MRLHRSIYVVGVVLGGSLLAGCGQEANVVSLAKPTPPLGKTSSGPARTDPRYINPNDPALSEAAAVVRPVLEGKFRDSFAGLRLDMDRHEMTIYRKPDPQLDNAVRPKVPDIKLVFRDARFSRLELLPLQKRITADHEYWQSQGIDLQGIVALHDGSGIQIQTPEGSEAQRQAIARYYRTDAIYIEKRRWIHAK